MSKRLKTEKDKMKWSNIYDDIWIHKLPIPEIVEKCFGIIDDIMTSEHYHRLHKCKVQTSIKYSQR